MLPLLPRPQYQTRLEQAIAALGYKAQNTLVFYGPSGIGKTGLRKVLARSLQPPNLPVVLNGSGLKEHSTPGLEQGVRLLRNALGRQGVDLRCFDLAYAYYWALANPHIAFDPTDFSDRMDEADTISTAGDLLGALVADLQKSLPWVGTASKLIWFLIKFSEPVWHWYKESGCDLKKLDECGDPYEVLELLPSYFTESLKQYLREHKQNVVILVDGYDDLLDESGHCAWLEQLMAEPNPYVLWVFFSERPLSFVPAEKQIPLLPLSEAESWNWLQRAGIEDRSLCETIIQSAQGLPLQLSAAVKAWSTIKTRRLPQAADFAQNLQELFFKLDAAWEPDERRMLQILSVPRTWDQQVFEHLMSVFQLDLWRDRWSEVVASPYIELVAAQKWQLNPGMRQSLQESQPVAERSQIHQELYQYYQAEYADAGNQLSSLEAALYHGLEAIQPKQAMSWFLEQVPQQQQGGHQALIFMLQCLIGAGKPDQPSQPIAVALTLLGRSQMQLGQWESALKALEQAKAQWSALQLENSAEAATVELTLAQVYLRLGQTFDANNACLRSRQMYTVLFGANSPEVAEVLNRQAEVAARQGNYSEAVTLSGQALQILQAHPGTQPLQLAGWKKTAALFRVYNNQRDEAARLCTEAMQLAQAVGGSEHPLAILSQALLGYIYERMGAHKYPTALAQYEQALDAAEIVFGPAHGETLILLESLSRLCRKMGQIEAANEFAERHNANIGLSNFEATAATAQRAAMLGYVFYEQGYYGRAEPLLTEALSIYCKVLGNEHPNTVISLNNLAALYDAQGRYEAAELLYSEALSIRRKVLGNEHPDTATSLNNLATLYSAQGRYEAAEPLLNESLSIRRKVLGNEHPDTALTLNNLALLYKAQGRYEAAEPLLNESLSIRRKVLGNDHPDTATSLSNLATLYDAQGRYEAAEPLYSEALSIYRRTLGNEHPYTATSLNNLALLYKAQGRYEAAEPLLNESLSIRRKVLGNEHPDTATSLNNLALLYDAQGRYEAAEPLYSEALSICRRTLGNEHPYIAASLNNLANLYQAQGCYEAAEPLLNESLSIRRKVLGNEHPDTALTLNNLAALYDAQGRYEAAEPLYSEALSICRRTLGNEHPYIAASLNNLANLYQAQGCYEAAELLLTEGLSIRCKALGDEHPDTKVVERHLEDLSEDQ
ncbi:tetratricopeptide repeat protein [Trichocoleus desertorum AS-A10]|uniref:tetratricopeptide repeat protein n=1 Tax=Trichocoleus desertorum TaxID=1481672 RepID=UPI0032977A16